MLDLSSVPQTWTEHAEITIHALRLYGVGVSHVIWSMTQRENEKKHFLKINHKTGILS